VPSSLQWSGVAGVDALPVTDCATACTNAALPMRAAPLGKPMAEGATLSPTSPGQAAMSRSVGGAMPAHPATASETAQLARREKVIVVLSAGSRGKHNELLRPLAGSPSALRAQVNLSFVDATSRRCHIQIAKHWSAMEPRESAACRRIIRSDESLVRSRAELAEAKA
jgi:hypothetical protein